MNAGSVNVPVREPGTISHVVRPCPSVPSSATLSGWGSKPGMKSDVSARATGKLMRKKSILGVEQRRHTYHEVMYHDQRQQRKKRTHALGVENVVEGDSHCLKRLRKKGILGECSNGYHVVQHVFNSSIFSVSAVERSVAPGTRRCTWPPLLPLCRRAGDSDLVREQGE